MTEFNKSPEWRRKRGGSLVSEPRPYPEQPALPSERRAREWVGSLPSEWRGAFVSRVGNDYDLSWHMRDGMWATPRIAGIAAAGSDGPRTGPEGVHQIRKVDVLASGVDVGVRQVVRGGAGWSDVTAAPAYWRTNTAGDFVEWRAPAPNNPEGKTSLAVKIVQHPTGGGIARVLINGDPRAARSLPTAQELVDAGRLQSAQLTTGGGTIHPLDRCYASYAAATTETWVPLGEGFGPAPLVRIEHANGWRASASLATNQRIMFSGFGYCTGEELSGPKFPVATLSTRESAWEYATSCGTTVANSIFCGSFHGNETELSFNVWVDNQPVAMVGGDILGARDNVRCVKTSKLVHPVGGDIANVTTVYAVDRRGLSIDVTITWVQAGFVTATYAMMPLNGPREVGPKFTRGSTGGSGWGTCPSTVGTDIDVVSSESSSAMVLSDRWAAVIWVEDYALWRGLKTGGTNRATVVEARALAVDSSLTKVYVTGIKDTAGAAVAPGAVHRYKSRVSFGNFPEGTERLERL